MKAAVDENQPGYAIVHCECGFEDDGDPEPVRRKALRHVTETGHSCWLEEVTVSQVRLM